METSDEWHYFVSLNFYKEIENESTEAEYFGAAILLYYHYNFFIFVTRKKNALTRRWPNHHRVNATRVISYPRRISIDITAGYHHHHHQVPDLEQTLATMPLQTSLSSDNFKKFKPLLCPPVAELQRLSRNVIRCLPLSRLPSTLPVKDKNSKPLRLHTCPKNSICLFLIVFNSDL